MKQLLLLLVASAAWAEPTPPTPDVTWRLTPGFMPSDSPRAGACEHAAEVKRALTKPGDGGVELGTLSGQRAAVRLDGPAGSGRFWEVSVGVATDAGVIGTCFTTSTVAHRFVSDAKLAPWKALAADRLVTWTSVSEGNEDAMPSVLAPQVWALKDGALVFDRLETATEAERFAAAYEPAHGAAAVGFRTWAALQRLQRVEVPAELLTKTRPLELSGLTWVPSLDRFLFVSDDTGFDKTPSRESPWLFALSASGHVDPAPVVLQGLEKLDDAESITTEKENVLWVVTSHSHTTKGKVKAERRQLLHVAVEHGALRVTERFDLMSLGLEQAVGAGVDLEAVAFHEGKVLVGLKAPLDAQGRAQLFSFDPTTKQLAPWKQLSLVVNGVHEGVSDVLRLPDGRWLLAANAPKGGPLDHGGALWLLDRDATTPKLWLHFPGLKPEGLSLTPRGTVAVVFDRQDAPPEWLELTP